jgi:hypothetical protein
MSKMSKRDTSEIPFFCYDGSLDISFVVTDMSFGNYGLRRTSPS